MINSLFLRCPCCRIPFGFQNTPKKLKNCQHDVCINCLKTQKVCPADNIDIDMSKYGLRSFLTNTHILEQINNQHIVNTQTTKDILLKQTQNLVISSRTGQIKCRTGLNGNYNNQFCLIHTKKADLFCQKDKQFVCSACSLFGSHKGHQIISYGQIIQRITQYSDLTYKTYESLKDTTQQFSNKRVNQLIQAHIIAKRDAQIRKIRANFHQILQKLRNHEKTVIKRLQSRSNQMANDLKRQINLDSFEGQCQNWVKQVHLLTKVVENVYNEKQIQKALLYLNQNSQKQALYSKGQSLIQKIVRNHQNRRNYVQNKSNDLQMQCKKLKPFFDNFILDRIEAMHSLKNDLQGFLKQARLDESNHKIIQQIKDENIIEKEKLDSFRDKTLNADIKPSEMVNYHQMIDIKPSEMVNYHLTVEQEDFLLENTLQIEQNHDIIRHQITFQDKFSLVKQMNGEQDQFTPILTKQQASIADIQQCRILDSNVFPNQSNQKQQPFHQENTQVLMPFMHRGQITKIIGVRNKFTQDTLSFTTIKNSSIQTLKNCRGPLRVLAGNNSSRRKKIQIPEKYRQVWEDAKNDKCETIDLTGAQLGDSLIMNLGSYISSSQKTKSLKLIRNKLTDEIMFDLLCFIRGSSIVSLNLSQNNFTQKCLEVLQILDLGNLKTITLSLNKIILRKVKDRIENFKQKGITLSV